MGAESLHFSSLLADVGAASLPTTLWVVKLYITLKIKRYTQAYILSTFKEYVLVSFSIGFFNLKK